MDEKNQWNEYITEANNYPEALQNTIHKLEHRINKNRFAKLKVSLLSAAAVFLLFIILVNTSTVFANGITNIPVLSTLAEFVSFDNSFSNAIKNEYVQEVDLTATNGDITLSLPYIIVDEQNIVLFFQLPKEIKTQKGDVFNITSQDIRDTKTHKNIQGYSVVTSSSTINGDKQDGLFYLHYRFYEGIPKSFTVDVNFEVNHYNNQIVQKQDENKYDATDEATDEITDYATNEATDYATNDATDYTTNRATDESRDKINQSREIYGPFTFTIAIDSSTIATHKTYKVDKEYLIEGQKLVIEEVSIYPTETEVYVTSPEDNTAWITDLELEVVDENKKVLKGANGISSSGDGKWKKFYIESNYFDTPKEQSLMIKGISLIKKQEEYVTLDLNKKTMTPEIKGLQLIEVKKEGKETKLSFAVESSGGFSVPFSSQYWDSTKHQYNTSGFFSDYNETENTVSFYVEYPENGIVILQRVLSPMTKLTDPIIEPLKPYNQ